MIGAPRPIVHARLAGRFVPSLLWLGVLAAVTLAMLPVRAVLNEAHVALAYLIVVLGGSARRGRTVGLTLAVLAFLCFDVLFLPPYGTLAVESLLDWLVLVAFLVTSVVATQLFERARTEAQVARERAAEVDRLSALGAETLSAGRAEEALSSVVEVIRSALALDACAVYLYDEEQSAVRPLYRAPDDAAGSPRSGFGDVVARVARSGSPVAVRATGVIDTLAPSVDAARVLDGVARDVRDLLMPLTVRSRIVGVLAMIRSRGFDLDPPQRRFLGALAYYAALGAERVRLVAQAEHADALREASRLKDAVVASVSHDLRTPLTTIKALAHDLAATGDERAVAVEEEADRLNALVAGLLDLSRLNSGAAVLAPEPNEAEDLLGAALQRVGGATDGRDVRVSLGEGEPLLFGRFDFAHTLRALVNLIENALKYSPRDQPVDVALRRDGEWLTFSVADRGPGVPAGEGERIFEPFYRPPHTAPDVGGAGLGLSIARAVAQAQGGSLGYESRAGGGSVFTLRVPAVDVDDLASA